MIFSGGTLSAQTTTSFGADYSNRVVDYATGSDGKPYGSFFTFCVQKDGVSAYIMLNSISAPWASFHANDTVLTVPNEVKAVNGKTYKIIGLGNACCNSLTNLREVYLGDGVKYLDDHAFVNCPNLRAVHGNGITGIGNFCFGDPYTGTTPNSELVTVDFPNLELISGWSFANCTKLEKVDFPKLRGFTDNVTNAFETFLNCFSLKEVNLPNMKEIGCRMFENCKSLERISLPEVEHSVKGQSMRGYTFLGCTSLRYVSLPKLSDAIDVTNYMFFNNGKELTALDTLILSSVPSISNACNFPPSLSYVDISSAQSVAGIPEDYKISLPFQQVSIKSLVCKNSDILEQILKQYDCNNGKNENNESRLYGIEFNEMQKADELKDLKSRGASQEEIDATMKMRGYDNTIANIKASMTLYDGLTKVEFTEQKDNLPDNAFEFIPNVESIVYGRKSDKKEAYNPIAFESLKNLKSVSEEEGNDFYRNDNGVLYSKEGTLFYYPQKNEDEVEPWHINRKVYGVGARALYGHRLGTGRPATHHELHLSTSERTDTTFSVGRSAMENSCIDHVTFDGNIRLNKLDTLSFAGMTDKYFRYLRLPAAVDAIGAECFRGDSRLLALEMQHTAVRKIESNTFAGMTSITSIALPDGVTDIGDSAFLGNTAMRSFSVPRSCTSIGTDAFGGTKLSQVYIPDYNAGVAASLDAAFKNAVSKPTLVVPEADKDKYTGWTTISAGSDEYRCGRYVEFSRNYPVSISAAVDGRKDRVSVMYVSDISGADDNGMRTLRLRTLSDGELSYIPANTPVLLYGKPRGSNIMKVNWTAVPSSDVPSWAKGNSEWLKAAPAAMRLDRYTDQYGNASEEGQSGNEETFRVQYTADYPSGVYTAVADKKWYEESTLAAGACYLRLPVPVGQTSIKGINLVIDDYSTGITDIAAGGTETMRKDSWYSIDGKSLQGRPAAPGVYIHNGRKVVVGAKGF